MDDISAKRVATQHANNIITYLYTSLCDSREQHDKAVDMPGYDKYQGGPSAKGPDGRRVSWTKFIRGGNRQK